MSAKLGETTPHIVDVGEAFVDDDFEGQPDDSAPATAASATSDTSGSAVPNAAEEAIAARRMSSTDKLVIVRSPKKKEKHHPHKHQQHRHRQPGHEADEHTANESADTIHEETSFAPENTSVSASTSTSLNLVSADSITTAAATIVAATTTTTTTTTTIPPSASSFSTLTPGATTASTHKAVETTSSRNSSKYTFTTITVATSSSSAESAATITGARETVSSNSAETSTSTNTNTSTSTNTTTSSSEIATASSLSSSTPSAQENTPAVPAFPAFSLPAIPVPDAPPFPSSASASAPASGSTSKGSAWSASVAPAAPRLSPSLTRVHSPRSPTYSYSPAQRGVASSPSSSRPSSPSALQARDHILAEKVKKRILEEEGGMRQEEGEQTTRWEEDESSVTRSSYERTEVTTEVVSDRDDAKAKEIVEKLKDLYDEYILKSQKTLTHEIDSLLVETMKSSQLEEEEYVADHITQGEELYGTPAKKQDGRVYTLPVPRSFKNPTGNSSANMEKWRYLAYHVLAQCTDEQSMKVKIRELVCSNGQLREDVAYLSEERYKLLKDLEHIKRQRRDMKADMEVLRADNRRLIEEELALVHDIQALEARADRVHELEVIHHRMAKDLQIRDNQLEYFKLQQQKSKAVQALETFGDEQGDPDDDGGAEEKEDGDEKLVRTGSGPRISPPQQTSRPAYLQLAALDRGTNMRSRSSLVAQGHGGSPHGYSPDSPSNGRDNNLSPSNGRANLSVNPAMTPLSPTNSGTGSSRPSSPGLLRFQAGQGQSRAASPSSPHGMSLAAVEDEKARMRPVGAPSFYYDHTLSSHAKVTSEADLKKIQLRNLPPSMFAKPVRDLHDSAKATVDRLHSTTLKGATKLHHRCPWHSTPSSRGTLAADTAFARNGEKGEHHRRNSNSPQPCDHPDHDHDHDHHAHDHSREHVHDHDLAHEHRDAPHDDHVDGAAVLMGSVDIADADSAGSPKHSNDKDAEVLSGGDGGSDNIIAGSATLRDDNESPFTDSDQAGGSQDDGKSSSSLSSSSSSSSSKMDRAGTSGKRRQRTGRATQASGAGVAPTSRVNANANGHGMVYHNGVVATVGDGAGAVPAKDYIEQNKRAAGSLSHKPNTSSSASSSKQSSSRNTPSNRTAGEADTRLGSGDGIGDKKTSGVFTFSPKHKALSVNTGSNSGDNNSVSTSNSTPSSLPTTTPMELGNFANMTTSAAQKQRTIHDSPPASPGKRRLGAIKGQTNKAAAGSGPRSSTPSQIASSSVNRFGLAGNTAFRSARENDAIGKGGAQGGIAVYEADLIDNIRRLLDIRTTIERGPL